MQENLHRITSILFVVFLSLNFSPPTIHAQNTPCSAISLSSSMPAFQTFNTNGLSNSGVENAACGSNIGNDIWFEVTVSPTGYINIVTLPGGLFEGAMAIYTGTCNNLEEFACTESDNCGNSIMPIWDWGNLTPGTTLFIRVWAESGPDGDFQIQVTDTFTPPGPDPLVPVGSAQTTSPECVQLTGNSTGQAGCAWAPNQVDFTQPFSNTVTMNFGTIDGNGADGICMVYQNDPAGMAACGSTGGMIGAGGITNSFIIEFDTWNNGAAASDIGNDHVSIDINGDINNAINGPFDLGNIEDGVDHDVTFTWNPATMFYEVFFDGNLVLSGNFDIITNCFGGVTNVWCGFASSTGGAFNTQVVCNGAPTTYPSGDQSVEEVEICEGQSYFAGGGNQTTSGTYFDTFSAYNGCDSVITTILTVNPSINVTQNESICEGESFFAGGAFQTTSGTYTDSYTTPAGCDSIVTTVLTVNPATMETVNESICEGQSYFAGGAFQTTSGTYTDVFMNANGCDSTIITNLTVDPNIQVTENPSICEGESYFAGGALQTTSGTYTDVFVTAAGCDSTVITNLTVNPNVTTNLAVSICDGESYFVGGANQTTGGTYTDQYMTSNGCDSTVITVLTVNPNQLTNLTETICEGESFFVGGANQTTSGFYTDNYMTSHGCDSVVITQLIVNPNSFSTQNPVICDGDSFFAGGAFQTTSGTYTDVYTSANGCDSTVTTILTVNPNVQTDLDVAICEGESHYAGGNFQTTSGTYTDVYVAANGCDSTVITNLTVNLHVQTNLNVSICEGDVHYVGGGFQTIGGTYTDVYVAANGCDSTVITQLTVVGSIATIDDPLIITCDNPVVTLDGSGSTSGAGVTYLWTASDENCIQGDLTSNTIEVTCPDIYTLIVFQDIGQQQCVSTAEVVVLEYTDVPVADVVQPTELNCSNPCITLDASGSDSGAPYSPTWTLNGEVVSTELNPTVCEPGTYILTITNEDNGCFDQASVEITLDGSASFADAGGDALLDCENSTVTLDGSNSTIGPDYTLQWEDSSNTVLSNNTTLDVSTPGTYILSVFNQTNGCNSADTVTVTVDMESPVAVIGNTDILDCATTSIGLDGTGSTPSTDYSFSWQSPLGSEIGVNDIQDINSPGTYFLVVTNDINHCIDTTSVEITQNITPPVANAGPDQIIDCATSQVTFDGSNSTGMGALDFLWQDDTQTTLGNTVTQDASNPGTYMLIVTDQANQCSDTTTVNLTSASVYPIANAGPDTLINCANPEIGLSANGSDTGASYIYEWQNQTGMTLGNEFDLQTDSTGTYTLLVTNTDNGCTSTDLVVVGEDFTPPFSDAGMDQVLDCISNSVTLDGSNSQQGSNISYQWSDGNNNPLGTQITLVVNAADTYTLEVTDANNGCSATSSIVVSQQIDAPTADAGLDMEINCASSSVTLDGSNSSFGPDVTIEWTNSAGNPLGNMLSLNTNIPDTYSLNLTDNSNGCTSVSNVVVSIDTIQPAVFNGQDEVLNCYNFTANIGELLSFNNPNWTFSWENQAGTEVSQNDTLTVSSGGLYTLTVFNTESSCKTEVTTLVTEDFTNPTADAGNDAVLDCVTASITLDGSNSDQGPEMNYQWYNSSNELIGSEITLDVNSADTYLLVVTNSQNGCRGSSTVDISQQLDAPIADAGSDLILNCATTQVLLDGSNSSSGPNISVEWTNEIGDVVGNSPQLQTAVPGVFEISVLDNSNGCISYSDATVVIDTIAPNALATPDLTLNCLAPTGTIGQQLATGNPNWTFEWTNSTNTPMSNEDTLAVSTGDTYSLVITNTINSCQTTLITDVIEDFVNPTVDAGQGGTITCTTQEITLDGSNSDFGSNFLSLWQDSQDLILGQTPTVPVSEPGVYQLNITNLVNGCIASDVVTVEIDTVAPIVVAGMGGTLTCTTTDIMLDAGGSTYNGNSTFSWTDESNAQIGTNITQNVNLPGVYTFSILNNDNGCENENDVTVLQNITAPVADAGEDIILNCYTPSGTLDAGNSSSGSNFEYEWQDPNTTVLGTQTTLPVDIAQTYTIVVTDNINGCESSDDVIVTENFVVPVSDAGAEVTLDCQTTEIYLGGAGTSTGATINYQWLNASGQELGTDINQYTNTAGQFEFVVFDNENGCSDTSNVQVNLNQDYPLIAGAVNDILTCAQLTVTLDATGTSEGPEFNYNWSAISGGVISPGSTDLTPFVSAPGDYQMIVINSLNSCADTIGFSVLQDIEPPVANAGATFELNCHAPVSNLNGILSSPAPLLVYEWSTSGGQFESATDIAQPTISFPGQYFLTVTNTENGCTDSDQVTITSNFITNMEVETEDPLCFGETGSILIPSVSGGVPPYQYSINGGQEFSSSNIFSNIPEGQYDVVIMDSNECLMEEVTQVVAPPELILNLDTEATILLGESYQMFAITNLAPEQIDTILWSPTESLSCTDCLDPFASPSVSTDYRVEIFDINGCYISGLQRINVDRRSNVFIPNVFSPNGDGNNDVFTIFSDLKSVQKVNAFYIYNRWGESVFEAFDFPTNDPSYGWDGLFRGRPLNAAVFVWYAEIEFVDGRVELFKGDVTLVR